VHHQLESNTVTIELNRHHPGATAQTISIRTHNLTADMTIAEGGGDEGPSPHDLYDAALGACKALTVLWYANKKGIPVQDIRTSITSDNTQERAGVYKIDAKLYVSGDLTDAQIRELETVAGKCPVHKLMTQATTEISTSMERLS
jgi:putative redox protein